MSRFIAKNVKRLTDENGEIIVQFKALNTTALTAVEEQKDETPLVVDFKKYKSKRSIEQNRLLWALLGKLSEAINGTADTADVWEIYSVMLEEVGAKYEILYCIPAAEDMLKTSFRAIRKIAEDEINGRTMNVYQCFYGSSKFDTAEMTKLIDHVVNRLHDLGIHDSEIEVAAN